MLSLSSLIEFLLDMLRDETTQNDFARDPNGTLAARGLAGVTEQDVHDVRPMLADHGAVRHVADHGGPRSFRGDDDGGYAVRGALHGPGGGYGGHGGGDPVRAIQQVTNEYHVDRSVEVHHVTQQEYNQYSTYNSFVDNSITQGDNGFVAQDSFNQDNDFIDNKNGELEIEKSVVAAGDVTNSANETDVEVTEEYHLEDHSITVTDSDNVDDTPSWSDGGDDRGVTSESFSGSTVNHSYGTGGSSGSGSDDAELVGSDAN